MPAERRAETDHEPALTYAAVLSRSDVPWGELDEATRRATLRASDHLGRKCAEREVATWMQSGGAPVTLTPGRVERGLSGLRAPWADGSRSDPPPALRIAPDDPRRHAFRDGWAAYFHPLQDRLAMSRHVLAERGGRVGEAVAPVATGPDGQVIVEAGGRLMLVLDLEEARLLARSHVLRLCRRWQGRTVHLGAEEIPEAVWMGLARLLVREGHGPRTRCTLSDAFGEDLAYQQWVLGAVADWTLYAAGGLARNAASTCWDRYLVMRVLEIDADTATLCP